MEDGVTDITLLQLAKAEEAARRGAYNLYDKISALKKRRDIRIIERAIYWCASDEEVIKFLGVETLESWENFNDTEIEVLGSLTVNENPEVRSWATFYLGVQCNVDSERVREFLFDRIADTHEETRGEALVGLAKRKDERASMLIRNELESDDVSLLAVEAAEELADEELLSALESLRSWWDVNDELLQDAIKACKSNSKGA